MKNLELQKRVKELRNSSGLSQEELAENTGLSLRTIQRLEHGESIPRGDTLKRLSIALKISPQELLDWQLQEDDSSISVLNLSQLAFIIFPLFGIIIPMILWVNQKSKIKNADQVGKSILNYQITWSIILIGILIACMFFVICTWILVLWYLLNIFIILLNTVKYNRLGYVRYMPAIRILT